MTNEEINIVMKLDILNSELRCKNYDCDKEVIFCSQCSNVKYSDEEIADALRYAIGCIEKELPVKPIESRIGTLIETPEKVTWKTGFVCPVCGNTVKKYGRCSNRLCGQFIDWGDN